MTKEHPFPHLKCTHMWYSIRIQSHRKQLQERINLNSNLKKKVPERNESEFKPLKTMHCRAHIQIHDQPNVHQKDLANIKI